MTANVQRVNELMNSMMAFKNVSYQKSEMLNEMLTLQTEMVQLTFKSEREATEKLKIYDVEKHLEQMNRDCSNVVDEELKRFQKGAKEFGNLIRVEICGSNGERKAFQTLQYLQSRNIVLKNIELSDGNIRTEVDAVVILPGMVVIVEVKNTAKNIRIDEEGNYYRISDGYEKWDCSIAEKMTTKELLVKRALTAGGFQNIPVKSIVVFTNNKIQVQNESRSIVKCYANQLSRIIDRMAEESVAVDTEIEEVATVLQKAHCPESYCCEMDIEQFKRDFAELMAILEEASSKTSGARADKLVEEPVSNEQGAVRVSMTTLKYGSYLGTALISSALAFLFSTAGRALKSGR